MTGLRMDTMHDQVIQTVLSKFYINFLIISRTSHFIKLYRSAVLGLSGANFYSERSFEKLESSVQLNWTSCADSQKINLPQEREG